MPPQRLDELVFRMTSANTNIVGGQCLIRSIDGGGSDTFKEQVETTTLMETVEMILQYFQKFMMTTNVSLATTP